MLISRAAHSMVSGCLFRPGRRLLCAVVTFGLSSGSRVYVRVLCGVVLQYRYHKYFGDKKVSQLTCSFSGQGCGIHLAHIPCLTHGELTSTCRHYTDDAY